MPDVFGNVFANKTGNFGGVNSRCIRAELHLLGIKFLAYHEAMKRKLNPNLVRLWVARSSDEHWVFLGNQVVRGDTKPREIGPNEIEEIPETHADKNVLRAQIRETELNLRKLTREELEPEVYARIGPWIEPHIILSKDCFEFAGPVRLVIYSDKPFA